MTQDTLVILTARDEGDRIESTLRALGRAFPGARVWVADDGSKDATATIARGAGANVVSCTHPLGKGGAATRAARAALDGRELHLGGQPERHLGGQSGRPACRSGAVVVLCDGDLGESAALLGPLAEAVRERHADLAVAAFSRRVGGGLGVALGFARWAIRRSCGLELAAPISGQRALRADSLAGLLPFAEGFGMELGMTIDAAREGLRVEEIELDLAHRATGRTLGGFVHRGQQLSDMVRAYLARR